MSQFHFRPETYLDLMRSEIPTYDELQDKIASLAVGERILELGIGTGETARRILDRSPAARLIGIDDSEAMLAAARSVLPADRVDLRVGRLEDRLPAGPFDLVVSALCVHHLDGPGKADLFKRVAGVLQDEGQFVLGDVVVPEDPADAVTPVDGVYDRPSATADQLRWIREAGLQARVVWADLDLAVIVADRRA